MEAGGSPGSKSELSAYSEERRLSRLSRGRAVIREGPNTSVGKGRIDSDDPLRGRVSGRLSQYINRGVECNGIFVCSAEGVKEGLETPMVMLTLRGERKQEGL